MGFAMIALRSVRGARACAAAVAARTMDAAQREFYEQHGYLIVKNAISSELVARLNRDYDQKVQDAHRADAALGQKPGQSWTTI